MQPRQGDQGADEQADGQDDGDQLRQGQQGQLGHDPDALAAFDDDLELIEALAQQADSGQRRAGRHNRQADLAEKIALNQRHGLERKGFGGERVAAASDAGHVIHIPTRR
ncbi:hypothetical protein D3C72_1439440 [compost metagenome]